MTKRYIHIEVSNAAIGEVSSFPYGWCLSNHLGKDANVVSWDNEMSQRRDSPSAFESYVRNVISMEQSPMLIVRETSKNPDRNKMLQHYVNLGVIHDPLVINVNHAYEPYTSIDESVLLTGFQDYKTFNAPDGAPWKSRTNLS